MKVLPWVGGLRVGYKRSAPGTLDLGDLGQRQRIVAECRGLMDEGFDGIHVNVEPVANGDDDFLALLRALRTAIGHAASSPSPRPGPGPLRPGLRAQLLLDARLLRARRRRRGPGRDHGLRHRAAHPSPLPPLRLLRGVVGDRRLRALARARACWSASRPTTRHGLMHRKGVETPENALLGVVAGLRGRARAAPSKAWPSTRSGRRTRRTGRSTSACWRGHTASPDRLRPRPSGPPPPARPGSAPRARPAWPRPGRG